MEEMLNCPFCGSSMSKIEKNGVIIDRCPNCLGIWLDKGELDKIVQKRKKHYEKYHKEWGKPHVGAIPPEQHDDLDILIGWD
jgi:Zn-finger nucleic acid-binding protein